ncbi:hypothetical protein V6N13_088083 [Hibiscus sabdariffa]
MANEKDERGQNRSSLTNGFPPVERVALTNVEKTENVEANKIEPPWKQDKNDKATEEKTERERPTTDRDRRCRSSSLQQDPERDHDR